MRYSDCRSAVYATEVTRALGGYDGTAELYGAVLGGRAPHLAEISSDVLATIGRPARALKEFARSAFSGA
jgi:hypothetical protein